MIRFQFRYDVKAKPEEVYDWWTELNIKPNQYLGKSLKEIKVIKREENQALIESTWDLRGSRRQGLERLTLYPPNRWVWDIEGSFSALKLRVRDEFIAEQSADGSTLRITSDWTPVNFLAKLLLSFVKRTIEKQLREEWDSANAAFHREKAAM